MKLCVGAVSPRVVEEACKLHVPQIIASRGQVDIGGGYTGWDQWDLVRCVRNWSAGETQVIRDHGGPLQGKEPDDGVNSFHYDVQAGFDGLHIDVCKLPSMDQPKELLKLIDRFGDSGLSIEIGGEHEDQELNDLLLEAVINQTEIIPSYLVIDTGGFVWAERQCGRLKSNADVYDLGKLARHYSVGTKAHNQDWFGKRLRYVGALDAYNIAPEFARIETDALLTVLSWADADELLSRAYNSEAWRKWFHDDEGTWDERARCAVHYIQEQPEVRGLLSLSEQRENYVRTCIRDAIIAG